MGFVIWYKVEIDEGKPSAGGLLAAGASLLGLGFPVKVSNDVLSGQYIIDADVTVNYLAGPFASTFEVKLLNLPKDVTERLKSKQDEGLKQKPAQPLAIKFYLGYFDDLPRFRSTQPVLEGAITKLKSAVGDDGVMVTTIRGQESTGYKLRSVANTKQGRADQQTVQQFVEKLLDSTGVGLAPNHGLTEQLKDFTTEGRNTLDVLKKLSDEFKLPLVVRDKQVFLKNAVGGGSPAAKLTEDDDIVSEDESSDAKEAPDASPPADGAAKKGAGRPAEVKPTPSLSLTVLGNPTVRPGQVVTVVHSKADSKDWRVEGVQHHFSSTSGFTTDLTLLQAKAGEQGVAPGGAFGIVQRIQDVAEGSQRNPIDVGEIKDYATGGDGKHLATLNFGQSPAAGVVAASVVTPVDDATQLFSKPILSPFAFHRCGLIVPIYPKMRAVLAHNRGLTNDAIVAGFLWAENPRLEPPKNKPGDYWLCLPTELTNGLPSGKGVNDLIDATGERVIQARGLKIFVGKDDLPGVGERPDVPTDLDGTIVIQHQKGTKITIGADGSVKIETKNQDISLSTGSATVKLGGSSPEVTVGNGSVTLKLSGSAVEVS